ncbi:MAG: Stk1 family PASTA domain-containing Ser/Thr kinase [Actinomycetota bacterium]|nr:Stk1 family PASTA domain-containing Ser/Thr kinase [Actinomycetota bacterium]
MDSQQVLADRYQLVTHLARGGMADVYEARDLLLDRRVAVKVLHSQLASDQAFVRRFRREAQAAANLSHPNIVSIYDWGHGDEGTYFIVMELIDGRTLREILRVEGRLLPRRAAEVAAEVASALAVAHRAGLVHRDIKPGNIMLTPTGNVKVTDFGIARAWDDSSELTRTGAVIGTATYFSPEQAQGQAADERSDIYALGVVLYEMLTGHPPFIGESPVSVAYQHVSSVAPPPSHENPDIPPRLDTVVMRSLEKPPDRRYQAADELREDLLRVLQGEALSSSEEGATRMMAPVPPPTVPPEEAYRQVARQGGGGQRLFILTVVGLLLALGLGLFALTRLLAAPSASAEPITVPDLAGEPEADALVQLQTLGLNVRRSEEPHEEFPRGTVIRTDPPAGTQVQPDSFVALIVSAGPEAFPVPRLIGLPRDEAESLIVQQGFVVGTVNEEPSEEIEAGQVMQQSPAEQVLASPGTPVNLTISTGPEVIVVPELVGRSERDAIFQLARLGLRTNTIDQFSGEFEEGFVIETEPPAGAEVQEDAVITLVVSQGRAPVAVPDLIGMTEDQARAAVEGQGLQLEVNEDRVAVTDRSQHGRVMEQSPEPGREVDPGSEVTVELGEFVEPTTTSSSTTTTTPEGTTTTAPTGTSP